MESTKTSSMTKPSSAGRQSHRHQQKPSPSASLQADTSTSHNSPTTTASKPQQYKASLAGSESKKSRKSKEVWIPEEYRRKQIERDLNLAKETTDAIGRAITTIRQEEARRENKSIGKNGKTVISSLRALERCKSKERHGLERRKPCGLCCRPFLPINLTMTVPLKAVLDIRDTWGDKFDPVGAARIRAKTNPNLRRAPACYNQTRVCAWCSQLFNNQQESYRPSFESKEAEKAKAREVEEARIRKKNADPLRKLSMVGINLI